MGGSDVTISTPVCFYPNQSEVSYLLLSSQNKVGHDLTNQIDAFHASCILGTKCMLLNEHRESDGRHFAPD